MADLDSVLTQGAQGEPNQAPGGSGVSDAELLSSLDKPNTPREFEPEFLERLKAVPVEKLRELRGPDLEKPYLAAFTRNQQTLAREREQLLDRLLAREGREAPPDERKVLLERLKQGDLDVIDQYLSREVQARVGPLEQQMALQNAVAQAQALHPFVKEKEQEIAQVIASDPVLTEMARADNFRYAPYVLQGAAMSLEVAQLKSELAAERANRASLVKQEIAKVSGQARSLPPTTSKAGSTPTATPSEGGKLLGFWGSVAKTYRDQNADVPLDVLRMAEREANG